MTDRKKKNRLWKALLALTLSVTLTLAVPAGSMAAETEEGTKLEAGEKAGSETKGKSLVLERTEGTVTIENARGKAVELRDGAKLYNGYRITTDEGYVWLSLDDTKLIKLDWYSEVTIKKNKKKLEVMLENGSLFFNVSKPLEEDEDLDIRSSTMSTGIRGTLGKVTVKDRTELKDTASGTSVELYEGKVEIAWHEESGDVVTRDVEAGYRAEVDTTRTDLEESLSAPVSSSSLEGIELKKSLEESGFVAIEVKEDEELRQRLLEADNGLGEEELQEIADQAEESLKKDQEEQRREAELLEKEIEKVKSDLQQGEEGNAPDQVFAKTEENSKEQNPQEKLEKLENTENPSLLPDTEDTRKQPQTEDATKAGSTSEDRKTAGTGGSGSSSGGSSKSDDSSSDSSGSGTGSSSGSTTPVPTPEIYSVTFYSDQKSIFAEEQVTTTVNGILQVYPRAEKPRLKPSRFGYWSEDGTTEFDFTSQQIKKDTKLYWVETKK